MGNSLNFGPILNEILTKIDIILSWLRYDPVPASVRFVTITHFNIATGEPIHMPQNLINDQGSNIPLEFDNVGGAKVNPPSAGTVTLTVTGTAAGGGSDGTPSTVATAALGSNGVSVNVIPTPADGTNLAAFTVTFDDAANVDLKATLDCQFTADSGAASVHFVTTGITNFPVGSPP